MKKFLLITSLFLTMGATDSLIHQTYAGKVSGESDEKLCSGAERRFTQLPKLHYKKIYNDFSRTVDELKRLSDNSEIPISTRRVCELLIPKVTLNPLYGKSMPLPTSCPNKEVTQLGDSSLDPNAGRLALHGFEKEVPVLRQESALPDKPEGKGKEKQDSQIVVKNLEEVKPSSSSQAKRLSRIMTSSIITPAWKNIKNQSRDVRKISKKLFGEKTMTLDFDDLNDPELSGNAIKFGEDYEEKTIKECNQKREKLNKLKEKLLETETAPVSGTLIGAETFAKEIFEGSSISSSEVSSQASLSSSTVEDLEGDSQADNTEEPITDNSDLMPDEEGFSSKKNVSDLILTRLENETDDEALPTLLNDDTILSIITPMKERYSLNKGMNDRDDAESRGMFSRIFKVCKGLWGKDTRNKAYVSSGIGE